MIEVNKKYLSPLRVLWLGTLLMIFVELMGIFMSATIGSFGAFFILLFGGFILMGVTQKFIGGWGAAAVALSALMIMMIGFGNAARPMWMAMTGQGVNATVVELSDSIIRSDLSGYNVTFGYRATRTGGRGHPAATEYVVAPLVNEKWTEGEEIDVWVVCMDTWDTDKDLSRTDKCVIEWKNNFTKGFEIDLSDREDVGKAVMDAMTKYGLSSSDSAKYIYSSSDPEDEVAVMVNFSIALLVLIHLGYIIAVLVNWRKIRVMEF